MTLARRKAALDAHQAWIYFAAMAGGALTGVFVPDTTALDAALTPALAVMLFATFAQMPLTRLGAAWRNGRFVAALLATQFAALPVVVAVLVQCLPADAPMLRLAVLLVLLAPCVDYVVAFTQLGGGPVNHHAARLLLAMTPLLLAAQMLLLPVYLRLLGEEAAHRIEAAPFLHALFWLIVVPGLLAAGVQILGQRTRTGRRALAASSLLPVPATALVLAVVVASVMPHIAQAQDAALRAAPVYLAFAVIAPLTGRWIARSLRLAAPATRALAFSAAYRNSLVILPLALAIPGGAPLVPAVILTQTLIELCCLPGYLCWMKRWIR